MLISLLLQSIPGAPFGHKLGAFGLRLEMEKQIFKQMREAYSAFECIALLSEIIWDEVTMPIHRHLWDTLC